MTAFLIKHYWHTPGMGSMNANKAPKLSNSAGSLITVLDAVLVNGFGSATVTMSIHPTDVSKAVITENNHGYSLTTRIRVNGCDNTNFNTEFEIIQIPDANTYVIDVTGLHSQDAGTAVTTSSNITVMIPSLGWTKEFSGTNLAVYRTKGGNRRYLWLDDSETTNGFAKVRGAWGAQGANESDLISPFPDFDQAAPGSPPRWWHRIDSNWTGPWASTTDIGWTIIGTDRFFFLSTHHFGGRNLIRDTDCLRNVYVFGDTNAYNQTDTSATILAGGQNADPISSGDYYWDRIYFTSTFSSWRQGYDYRQTFSGTWNNLKKPTQYRMAPPFADCVSWTDDVGLGRGRFEMNPFLDQIPIGQPVVLTDDISNCIRAEMPGMAVTPVYLNGIYQQNNIINVNGVRYMYMATRNTSGAYTNDGHFLVQIDGDMHTLKGTT
jgi:hypothetical protein